MDLIASTIALDANRMKAIAVPISRTVNAQLEQKPFQEIQVANTKRDQLADLAKQVKLTVTEKQAVNEPMVLVSTANYDHKDLIVIDKKPVHEDDCTDCDGSNPCTDCADHTATKSVPGAAKTPAEIEASKAKRKKLFMYGGIVLAVVLLALFIVKKVSKSK